MAVQYDKENGFTIWLSKFKEDAAKISDEVNTLFKNVIPDKNDTESWLDLEEYIDLNGIDSFIDKYKIADENFKEFLDTIDNAKFDMQDYHQYLIKSGKSTSTFTTFTQKPAQPLNPSVLLWLP